MRWSQEHGGFWEVTGHAECRAVAGARTGFSSYPHVHIPPTGLAERGLRIFALESDDPDHKAERAVLRDTVGTNVVERMEAGMRSDARRLLDGLDWSGPVDLAGPFAYRLPLDVIGAVVGVPTDLVGELRLLTNTLLFRNATSEEVLAAADRVIEIAGLCDTDLEPRAAVALITGGHHSTSRGIGSLLARVISDRSLRDLLVAHPERIPDAAEETLRLHTPLPSFSRRATEEHMIGTERIIPGQQALMHYDMANRDARVYSEPERFDVDRRHHEHLAFGWGAHRCVGMHLARAEMCIALEEVLRAAPDVELAEPIEWAGPAEPAALCVVSEKRSQG